MDLSHAAVGDLVSQYEIDGRSRSAAFLIWYMVNYYRLDETDAVDAVCDGAGDKGVDALFIDDLNEEIQVLQSRLRQTEGRTVGDSGLRELEGTLQQFSSPDSIRNMIASGGDAEIAALLARLEVESLVGRYDIQGVFISNAPLDANGESYLSTNDRITFVGPAQLTESYVPATRPFTSRPPLTMKLAESLDVASGSAVDRDCVIVLVRASELVKMPGIADQTLFEHNVRGPLGGTQVNRDIARSIRDSAKHQYFRFFHNGITMISGQLELSATSITCEDYYVVNGCQSLKAFYDQRKHLTDGLCVFVKLIKVEPKSNVSNWITQYSNNQNGVRPRDFRSNNRTQIMLQNEIRQRFGDEFFYEIKRGETEAGLTSISNEDAGLWLMSFDLKEPWATHRRYRVFDEAHEQLFCRPEVTAARIVLLHLLMQEIQRKVKEITFPLVARYKLTQYLLLYILRLMLEIEPAGMELIRAPEMFIASDGGVRSQTLAAIQSLLNDAVVDLNYELQQLDVDFDYRGLLRDSDRASALATAILREREKDLKRGKSESFGELVGLC